MPPAEPEGRWRAWADRLALGWALVFGCLYLRTVLIARAPEWWARLTELADR